MIERREALSDAPVLSKVFSQVKKASLEALQQSAPRPKRLLQHWSELLRDLGLPESERARFEIHDLASLSKNLQTMDLRSFRKELLSLGESLARQKIDIEDGIALIESLSEDYLSALWLNGHRAPETAESQLRRTELALAVSRLCFLAVRILATGYSHQLDEERRIWNSSNRRADAILHRTSLILSHANERERYKISRQLQEKLGHSLVGLKLHLNILTRALGEDVSEECSTELDQSAALLDEGIRYVRRMVLDLGPAVVREVGLIPAVRMYVRQFSGRSWIDVTVEADDLPNEMPLVLQVALYRLSQQVLDFCRQSHAKNIKMSFQGKKGTIAIVVEQDEAPAQAPRKAVEESWLILCNRAHLLGADVHRKPLEVGTRIEILVPPHSWGRAAAGQLGKSRIAKVSAEAINGTLPPARQPARSV
jgi:signal transduction histidine kinase